LGGIITEFPDFALIFGNFYGSSLEDKGGKEKRGEFNLSLWKYLPFGGKIKSSFQLEIEGKSRK